MSSTWYTPGFFAVVRKDPRVPSSTKLTSVQRFLALLEADGLTPVRSFTDLSSAAYPVAVFTSKDGDFHFCRPDRAGGWWHKAGNLPAARKRVPFRRRGYRQRGFYTVSPQGVQDLGTLPAISSEALAELERS